jgi:hypothetical protein
LNAAIACIRDTRLVPARLGRSFDCIIRSDLRALNTRFYPVAAKDLLDGKALAIVLLQVILSIYQRLGQGGRD